MGRFRATYRDPVGKPGHVTKFGTGGGLADAMILREVAEMYPHLFIPEEIHPLPWKERSMQPDWLMTSKKDPEDYLMTMGERAVHPFAFTQREVKPLKKPPRWNLPTQIELQAEMMEENPLLHALGLIDVKPENWAADPRGHESPYLPTPAKMIDPMFGDAPPGALHRDIEAQGQKELEQFIRDRGWETPDDQRAALAEFAEPWTRTLYDMPGSGANQFFYGKPAGLMEREATQLGQILNPL